MIRYATAALAVLLAAGPARAQEAPADTWHDDAARELVRLARERRALIDGRISAYETTVNERISVGMRMGIGERLLYRRETASRIDWTLDTVRIVALGAREVIPSFRGAPQVPGDLSGYLPSLAFDPVESEMLFRMDSTSIRHPLATGSEANYRFRTGDSTVIALPGGRTVRLRELQFIPRRRDPQLITGSFWLDTESHAVVQAFFRLARAYDAALDPDSDVPGILRPVRADIEYVAIDYGLWEMRWWLPRSVAAQGLFQAGPMRMPISFERRYDAYVVTGDTLAPLPTADALDPASRPCRPPVYMTVTVGAGAEPDSATQRRREEARERRRQRAAQDTTRPPCPRTFVVVRTDSISMLESPWLPGDIYDGDRILDPGMLRTIGERVRAIPSAPWQIGRPVVQLGLGGPGLVRYNRVEGLAVGARTLIDFGGAGLEAEAHFGVANLEPSAQVSLLRDGTLVRSRVTGYHRLAAVDVAERPFSLGASLNALFLGRDENDYFRASGAELLLRPPETRRQWYDLRLFAEAQRSVERETDFSLPNLLGDHDFRPNLEADRANQLGAALRLRAAGGQNPDAFRWGAEAELHGESGDYQLLRPALRLRAGTAIGRVAIGTEVAGGTVYGDAPVQRLWQLGGGGTLRGYPAGVVRGDTYWRTRAELGFGMPFARLAVFGDAGWAGPRDDLRLGRPLRSAGFGASLLDGLVRFDLARALDAPRAWRLHISLDGVL